MSASSRMPWPFEEAGAFAVVLEGIPLDLAAEMTARLVHPDHRHRCRRPLRRPDPGACTTCSACATAMRRSSPSATRISGQVASEAIGELRATRCAARLSHRGAQLPVADLRVRAGNARWRRRGLTAHAGDREHRRRCSAWSGRARVAPRSVSAWCRRWATCTTGISAWCREARRRADRGVRRSSSTRCSSAPTRT